MQDKCDRCSGISKCFRSCKVHAGSALAKFLNDVNVTEAKIGEPYNFNGRKFIVSGHHVNIGPESKGGMTSGVKATPKDSTVLDVTEVFRLPGGSAVDTLKSYIDNVNLDDNFRKELETKLRKINKHKLLVMPIELGGKYDVEIVTEDKKQKFKYEACTALTVSWEADKQTGAIEARVVFSKPGKKDEVLKVDLVDYGITYKPVDLDNKLAGKEISTNILRLSADGFFYPIEITDGKDTIIVDNTYVYKTTEYGTMIIGGWDSSSNLKLNPKYKSALEKVIKKNEWYLKRNRAYIAPYGLYKTHKLTSTKQGLK